MPTQRSQRRVTKPATTPAKPSRRAIESAAIAAQEASTAQWLALHGPKYAAEFHRLRPYGLQ